MHGTEIPERRRGKVARPMIADRIVPLSSRPERLRSGAVRMFGRLLLAFRGPEGQRLIVALPILFALTAYYFFQSSAGTFRTLSWQTNYYDLLAEGFRHGHLYIPVEPSAELLAKTNPFDFSNQ